MTDQLIRARTPLGQRVIFARVTETARRARAIHGCYPTSAHLLAQGMAAGALLGALLDPPSGRVDLRIECDGPIGGLRIDADPAGGLRSAVNQPLVNFVGDPAQGARAALGGTGYLSVIRHLGGEAHRGAVRLEDFELAADLRRFFSASEQTATGLDLQVLPGSDGEPLGEVAGILVQRLPDGDARALQASLDRLAQGALGAALAAGKSAQEIIRDVTGEEGEPIAETEIAYRCGCSAARARTAVSALGREGLEEILSAERQAAVTCEFCRQRYVIAEAELRELLQQMIADAS